MKNKFYAVKIGKKTGIFQTWDECKVAIEGFSNAIYKSFNTLDDAEEFLHSENESPKIKMDHTVTNEQIDKIIAESDETIANVFVDGSRNEELTKYSYGIIIFHKASDGLKKITLYKSMIDPEGLALHQFAGEMKAAMVAIKWAIDQNLKLVNLFYDYEGIEKFATGEYKHTNNVVSADYVAFIKTVSSKISLVFHKVKAHSGITFNEEADSLAKRAVLESGFRTYKDGSFYVYGFGKKDWESVVISLNSRLEKPTITLDESVIKDNIDRLVISNETDKVNILVYQKSKSFLQGKQSQLLEYLVLESISYLKSSENVIEHLNRYHALQIENDEVYSLAGIKLPNILFEKLDPKIKLVFECSMYNYLITSNMPEYTSLVTPVFRICEYFLHHILGHILGNSTVTPDGKNNFSFFSKIGGYYEYNRSCAGLSITQINILNDLYNFYNKNRHIYSHWNSVDLESNIVTSMKEARDIMDESFILFDKIHTLFYT